MIVRFAERTVDFGRLEVSGPDGPLTVQPQVFALIQYLLEHRDRVVSHDELKDAVWGDRFVSDSAVTSRVKHARRVLGDSGDTQAIIRTVHGRGYHFVAELDTTPGLDADGELDAAAGLDADDHPIEDPSPRAEGHPAPTVRRDATTRSDDWPFAGRSELLQRVTEQVEQSPGGGVFIEGSDRVGRTRFLRTVADRLTDAACEVIWVDPGAPDTLLSSLSRAVSSDVFAAVTYESELAWAQLFQLAVADLESTATDRHRVYIIDDASRVDAMSQAVVVQSVAGGTATAVASDRLGQSSRFAELANSGALVRVRLEPLDESDVDTILYRHLRGPLDRSSLRRLWELSAGVPGVLRDIVDASRASGALEQVGGVWRLSGNPSSSRADRWPVTGLSDAAVAGAEHLALLRTVSLTAADDIIGQGVLDELDAAGLLSLSERDGRTVVSLPDELLMATIVETMPPVRRHRARRALADQLAEQSESHLLATVTGWGDEHASRIDPLRRLLGAVDALSAGDLRAAETLVDSLSYDEWPQAMVIKAEIDVQHGRHAHAEDLLDAVPVDRLDDLSRSLALRRRASIDFAIHHRHDETIDWLADRVTEANEQLGISLAARRVALLAYLGRYWDCLRAAGDLAGIEGDVDAAGLRASSLRGNGRLEVMLAASSVLGAIGRFDEALEAVDDAREHLDDLPPAWRVEPADHELMLRVGALVNIGRMTEAVRIVDENVPAGRVSVFGILPSISAEILLGAGRPRAAREIMRPAMSSAASQAFPQYVGLNAAMMARCAQATGADAELAESIAVVREHLPTASGSLRRRMAWQLGEMLTETDPPAELVELVDEGVRDARSVGALLGEMDLSCVRVALDPTPSTAVAMIDRIEEVAGRFVGDLWPIRIAHVRARADGAPLVDVEERYRRLGYVFWADRAARGR